MNKWFVKNLNKMFVSIIILIALIFILKVIGLLIFVVSSHATVFYKLDISLLLPLSAFGALIGYYQYNLQKERFKKDLFEERLNIFNILEKIVSTVNNIENIEDTFYDELNININKAHFLFNNQTYEFIKTFKLNCVNLSHSSRSYRPYRNVSWGLVRTSEELQRIKDLEETMLRYRNWIISFNELDKLVEKFPQLKFNED